MYSMPSAWATTGWRSSVDSIVPMFVAVFICGGGVGYRPTAPRSAQAEAVIGHREAVRGRSNGKAA